MSPTANPPSTRLRPAVAEDLDAIASLEARCFDADAQSKRSLRHILTQANACTVLAEAGTALAGYVSVLFRRGTRAARLYSIAVDPGWRGAAVGRKLLAQAEAEARRRGCERMRCELRVSNLASRALFTGAGYRVGGPLPGYYRNLAGSSEDGLRLEKHLSDMEEHG